MVTESELREQLEDALEDILCFCGNYKRMGKPFCFQCFDSLPQDWQGSIRNAIHKRDCNACANEYDAAKEWLKKHHCARFQDRDSAPLL